MNKGKNVFQYVMLIVGPILTYYLMEAFTINALTTTRVKAQFLNIAVFELLMLFLLFLTGRAVAALEVLTAFFLLVGLLNDYVLKFRSTPIVPWDIFSIRTALSVAGNYSFSLGKREILVLLAFAGLFVVQAFVNIKISGKKWALRLSGGVAACGLLVGEVLLLSQDTFVTKANLYPFLFTPTYMSQANGFTVTFLMDLRYLVVEKPDGYDSAYCEKLLEEYERKAEELAQDNDTTLPNIIVIMDEAFSDLHVLGDYDTNEEELPFLNSLRDGADNTISGYLNVSVKGGNTANTEYEFLTGNSMAFLPAGSIPYQQYIKEEKSSLVTYLDSLGYRTIGMHPYRESGWNRNEVYPYLGFSQALFLNDFTHATVVRDYVSDQSDFDKIKELYEENTDKPLFLFNVTMQNHGSYSEGFANLEETIQVKGSSGEALNRYLSLLQLTDEALEDLLSYLSESERETVVVFFGDHQPNDTIAQAVYTLQGKSYTTLTEEETLLRYQVPYVIWANYDIEEETNADTSANFLASKVLKAAGVPLDGYRLFLQDVQEEYPIVSAEQIQKADGTILRDVSKEEGLSDYRCLAYYLLFDDERP